MLPGKAKTPALGLGFTLRCPALISLSGPRSQVWLQFSPSLGARAPRPHGFTLPVRAASILARASARRSTRAPAFPAPAACWVGWHAERNQPSPPVEWHVSDRVLIGIA